MGARWLATACADREVQFLERLATDIPIRAGDSGSPVLDAERRAMGMPAGLGGDRPFFMTLSNVIGAMGLAGAGPPS